MKNILFILVILLLNVFTAVGQSYITLGNFMGTDISQYEMDLNEKAEELIALLPSEYQDSFKVYSFEYYLHDNDIINGKSNIWSKLEQNIQINSKYHLIFGRVSSSNRLYSSIVLKLNLPPALSLSQCFTEIYRSSLENTLYTNLNQFNFSNNLSEYFRGEISTMNVLKSKLDHIINCCNVRAEEGSCSYCFYEIDDAIASLNNSGYFDLKKLFENLYGIQLNVELNSKTYTDISSNFEIILINSDNNIEYHLTDELENYKINYTDNNIFDVTVTLFDDDVQTEDIDCFEEEGLVRNHKRTSSVYSEQIVILKYKNNIQIFTKDIIDLVFKLPVYLYNNSKKTNDFMFPIMDLAFADANNIYLKNNLDIFIYDQIENEVEYNNETLNKREILYNFLFLPPGINCPIGRTSFLTGLDLEMDKSPDCFSGSFIDINKLDKSYEIGFTLAHEILHALTIRGSRLIGVDHGFPESIQDWACCKDGHFNWQNNLLMSGPELQKKGGFPTRNYNALDDREKILPEAMFFVLKSIFSNAE